MRMQFIGDDGSLGYHRGQVYDLRVVGVNRPRIESPHPCPYGSVAAFQRNWRRPPQTSKTPAATGGAAGV